MNKIFLICAILSASCFGQEKVDAVLIYDSKVNNRAASAIDEIDPNFFSSDYYWIVYRNFSLWGHTKHGFKFSYNYEDSTLTTVNGDFDKERELFSQMNFTGDLGFNFLFDGTRIAWLTKTKDLNTEIIRAVDVDGKYKKETSFNIPRSLQDLSPVIIDTDRLLYHQFVLHGNGQIDTLDMAGRINFPHDDKVFMRKNGYMVDHYFDQENPNVGETSPIEYNKIVGNRLVAQKINPPNVKISNYRVETNYENVWLFSHKVDPEKFMLYDLNTDKAYPFELDKTIFNLNNLTLREPVVSRETVPTSDVRFSYLTSMNDQSIYIYQIKNGIKLYRVSNYKEIMR